MLKLIAKYFEFKKHQTSFKVEILAGVSTFLSLAYIFVVNPSILHEGGMNKSMVLFATIMASFIGTFLMGIWANKPFAVSTGLEINSYVAFFVIGTLGFTWQEALGTVFWSGVIFIILTFSNIRSKIINSIPDKLKIALSASVGVFIIIISLMLTKILIYKGITIKGFGSPVSSEGLILLFGFFCILLFNKLKTRASILISIILSSILAHLLGVKIEQDAKVYFDSDMLSGIFKFDPLIIFNPKSISVILILFIIDFYGSIAKFIGLTTNTSILDENGHLPKMKEALYVDGISTTLGSALGTSSLITFVESAVGIGVGGRTGFTAIVCSLFMLLFLPLAPLVNLVPVVATSGTLLWVGIKMFPSITQISQFSTIELISTLSMIVIVALTFSLDKAMLVGFSVYILNHLFTRQYNKIDTFLVLSVILLILGTILTFNY